MFKWCQLLDLENPAPINGHHQKVSTVVRLEQEAQKVVP